MNKSQSKKELGDNLVALESEILEIANAHVKWRCLFRSNVKKHCFRRSDRVYLFSPQATYDAYILTIGSGRGDNWWCAMFPKICFPDKKEGRREKKSLFSSGSG